MQTTVNSLAGIVACSTLLLSLDNTNQTIKWMRRIQHDKPSLLLVDLSPWCAERFIITLEVFRRERRQRSALQNKSPWNILESVDGRKRGIESGVKGPCRLNRCPNSIVANLHLRNLRTVRSIVLTRNCKHESQWHFLSSMKSYIISFAHDQLRPFRKNEICRWIMFLLGPPIADRLSTLASKSKTSWTSSANFSFKLWKSCSVNSLSWHLRDSASATARPEMWCVSRNGI